MIYNKLFGALMVVFLINQHLNAQHNFEWGESLHGPGQTLDRGVKADNNGFVYSVGSFSNYILSNSNSTDTIESSSSINGFIQKKTDQGVQDWLINIECTGDLHMHSIDLDQNGDILVAGYYSDTADFDPTQGTNIFISNGGWDIFYAKYDLNGNLLWAQSIGGIGDDVAQELSVSSQGDVYITGHIDEAVDMDPGTGTIIESVLNKTGFILKVNSLGNYLWHFATITYNNASPKSWGIDLAVDLNDNIIFVGRYEGNIDCDPGVGVFEISSVFPNWSFINVFFIKLDSNGNFIHGGELTDGYYDTNVIYGVTTDHNNNSFLVGRFSGSMDFDPTTGAQLETPTGARDLYLIKLNAVGDFVFGQRIGGSGTNQIYPYDITTDHFGDVYLVGKHSGSSLDFNGVLLSGSFNSFIYKMTNSGISQWVLGYTAEPKCVDVDLDKNLYLQGNYTSSWADVDPTNGILNLPNNGNGEVYTIKLNQCVPTNSTINIDECDSYTSPNGSVLTVSGQYIDTIQNVGGCDSVITINLILTPSYLLSESTTICKGEDYTFPDGTIAYNIIDTLSHTSYLTSSESCDSIINTIVYIEILDASISLMGGVCQGAVLGYDNYLWLDCNDNMNAIPGATSATYIPEANGAYALKITNNGCSDTSSCLSINNVGIENLLLNPISIYPVPASNWIFVDADNEFFIDKTITITDILGKTKVKSRLNKKNYIDLPTGVYILLIENANGIVELKEKIIVTRN
jgi:hypothetical protein